MLLGFPESSNPSSRKATDTSRDRVDSTHTSHAQHCNIYSFHRPICLDIRGATTKGRPHITAIASKQDSEDTRREVDYLVLVQDIA